MRKILWIIYFILGFDSGLKHFWILTTLRSYPIQMSTISSLLAVPYIPWCLKFIPWLVSSKYGVAGKHRKPHLLLGLFMVAVMCIPLSFPISLSGFIASYFFFHWWIVWAWVNITGLAVEDMLLLTDKEKTQTQTLLSLSECIGRTIGGMLGGPVWQMMPGNNTGPVVGAVYAALFILVMIFLKDYGIARPGVLSNAYGVTGTPDLTVRGRERPIPISEELRTERDSCFKQCLSMHELLNNPYLRGVIIYNLIYSLFPSYDVAFWFMQQDVLKFTPWEMGVLGAVGELGEILALTFYYFKGDRIRINCYYIALGVLTVLTSIPPLLLTWSITYDDKEKVYLYDSFGLDPHSLVMGRNVFGEFFDRLHSLPPQQLAGLFCKSASSAGGLAALGSINNIIAGIGLQVDAGFYHLFGVDNKAYEGLKWLVLLRICLDLTSSLFTWMLPGKTIHQISKEERNGAIEMADHAIRDEFTLTTSETRIVVL